MQNSTAICFTKIERIRTYFATGCRAHCTLYYVKYQISLGVP